MIAVFALALSFLPVVMEPTEPIIIVLAEPQHGPSIPPDPWEAR